VWITKAEIYYRPAELTNDDNHDRYIIKYAISTMVSTIDEL